VRNRAYYQRTSTSKIEYFLILRFSDLSRSTLKAASIPDSGRARNKELSGGFWEFSRTKSATLHSD
jgi:hypothetical protein